MSDNLLTSAELGGVRFSTQAINTQQGGGQSSPVLGHLASRYLDEYGLGSNSKYVALRACSVLPVSRSGAVLFGDSTFAGSGTNQTKIRGTGVADFPTAEPKSWTRTNLTIDGDYGLAVELDPADDSIRDLLGSDGSNQAAMDELGIALAVNELLKALDAKLFAVVAPTTSPFDAADVDAASADWNDATTAIVANFETARRNLGGRFDSMIWDETSESYFRQATELTTRFGGNVGAGSIGDDGVKNALQTMGIKNVFTTATASALGEKVILYQGGTLGKVRTAMDAGGIVLGYVPQPGEDEFGISYSSRLLGDGRVWRYVAWMRAGFMVQAPRGVRIKNHYT